MAMSDSQWYLESYVCSSINKILMSIDFKNGLFFCDFFIKVTCASVSCRKTKDLSELNTFRIQTHRKTTISSTEFCLDEV